MALALVVAVALGVGIGIATSGSPQSAHRPAKQGGAAPATSAHSPVAKPSTGSGPPVDLGRLVGQLIVGHYTGPRPSAAFLARVRAGQLGSVILFSDNTAAGLARTRHAIAELQAAARQGRNPPLLVMTDQEGGEVRRLPGPPELAPAEMTSAAVAHAQTSLIYEHVRGPGIYGAADPA